MTTIATADSEQMCTWTTNREVFGHVEIVALQDDASPHAGVKGDGASRSSEDDGLAEGARPRIIECGDQGQVGRRLQEEPTRQSCR